MPSPPRKGPRKPGRTRITGRSAKPTDRKPALRSKRADRGPAVPRGEKPTLVKKSELPPGRRSAEKPIRTGRPARKPTLRPGKQVARKFGARLGRPCFT